MSRLGAVLALVMAVGYSTTVSAASVRLGSADSALDIRSITKKKQVFLRAGEVAEKLPVAIRRDSTSGLIVLCTLNDCVPVFEMDTKQYQRKDSVDYVAADVVAAALGCGLKMEKKELVLVPPAEGLSKEKVGPRVGDHTPGFRLLNGDSVLVSSADLLRHGPLVIVFFRSAEWDPICKAQLTELETKLDSIRGAGATLVAIHGYDLKMSRKWQKELRLSYPLLSDPYAAVMRGYEVFDKGHLPYPAVFVIDRKGVIQLRDVHEDPSTRTEAGMIMKALGGVGR
jgi:peroxiredoxin